MIYSKSNHQKFLIMFHLILVTKYRMTLKLELWNSIKEISKTYFQKFDIEIIEAETDKDKSSHIHYLIKCNRLDFNLKSVIIGLKRNIVHSLYNSSWKIYLKSIYFHKDSFYVALGMFPKSIRNYIEKQG